MVPKLYSRELYEKVKPKDKGVGCCPFCKETREEEYVIHETEFFTILHNKFPVLGLDKHLLVAPKNHLIYTSDMSVEESANLVEVEKFMKEFFKGEEYFSFIRQSNGGNARSIQHFHYHYLPGEVYNNFIGDMLKHQGFKDAFE